MRLLGVRYVFVRVIKEVVECSICLPVTEVGSGVGIYLASIVRHDEHRGCFGESYCHSLA